MTSINNIYSTYKSSSDSSSGDEVSFNEKFLNYVKENRPEGSLSEILEQAKSLSADKKMTMSQLSSALLYADTILRADADYQDYTSTTLDKNASQMLGLNMLTSKMMEKLGSSDDDEDQNII